MDEKIELFDIWTHFKGKDYLVVDFVFDADGDDLIKKIVYIQLDYSKYYADSVIGNPIRYLRSFENFFENIERENYNGPRFHSRRKFCTLCNGTGWRNNDDVDDCTICNGMGFYKVS